MFGERIVAVTEVKEPVLTAVVRALALDVGVPGIFAVGEGAGRRVPTDVTAVQEQHHLCRVDPPFPEGELAAVGALAVASRFDPCPLHLFGGTAGGEHVCQHEAQSGQHEEPDLRHASQGGRSRTGRAPTCGHDSNPDFRRVSSGGAEALGLPDMKDHVAALAGALRRSSVQDAGLAALLLIGTWAAPGAAAAPARWILIGVCIAAVAVRRGWPIPALAAASLASIVQMALAAQPVAANLAVPMILYTIAAHRQVKVSLALLGAALAVTTAWSAYVSGDGKTDGLPIGAGGQTSLQSSEEPETLGPTDWGGIPVLGSLLVVAWAIGWGVQSRRAYLGERAALAVAAERARITREVHDVVAHGLAVIVMQAQGGAAAFANRPTDTLAALDTIVATGRASLADLRHVLSAPEEIDGAARPVSGLDQLPGLIDQVRRVGTPVELHIDGSPRPLPASVDVSSYRIIQEALTNTMKHAGPGARARVTLSYTADELRLEASDNGAGDTGITPATGNGLKGMRERAALLGGEVAAGPGPEGGYVVRARIPVDLGETA